MTAHAVEKQTPTATLAIAGDVAAFLGAARNCADYLPRRRRFKVAGKSPKRDAHKQAISARRTTHIDAQTMNDKRSVDAGDQPGLCSAFLDGNRMNEDDDIISADGQYRIVFFMHAEGTHGYAAFRNANDANSPMWRREHHSSSRFASRDVAVLEARSREAWLKTETAWPARHCDPVPLNEFGSGWLRCPFCRIRFSILDKFRWGGGRHLTCGQRIIDAGNS